MGSTAVDNPKYDAILICKNYLGENLWSVDLNETMNFGDQFYPPPFSISCLKVFEVMEGHFEVFAALCHYPMFPSKLSRISSEGVELSQYYHGGHILDIEMADITGDGRMEILFSGINNENRNAILGAMAIDNLRGHSPQLLDNYTFKKASIGNHLFYLRFPSANWLDMGEIGNTPKIWNLEKIGAGGFLVTVVDQKIGYEVIYTFNAELKLLTASITDLMNNAYTNTHGHSLYEDYTQEIIKEKLYDIKSWDGKKWVDFIDFQDSPFN